MYTHPLFKKRRRLSPPQASLGDYECACSRSEKKKTKQGAWFYRALLKTVLCFEVCELFVARDLKKEASPSITS